MSQPAPQPALTVIIPTYNRSGFVRDCLVALRETGVPDLEIIVADDGSTDDTEQVVTATDPTARYFRQANAGPAVARNRAFDLSRGRYVGFLDCDDLWLPRVPAKAIALLDRHPDVDVLFADARMGNAEQGYVSWIEVAGQQIFWQMQHRELEPGFRVLERTAFFHRMLWRNAVFIGTTIMRREAFERAGRFDPELCGAADWNLWLRMASSMTFGFLAEPLGIYTRHLDNMSSNLDVMNLEFIRTLERLPRQCPLSPADRKCVRRHLQRQRFVYGYRAFERGDFAEARHRFGRMFAGGFHLRGWAMLAACLLPGPLIRGLRNLRHSWLSAEPDAPTANQRPAEPVATTR